MRLNDNHKWNLRRTVDVREFAIVLSLKAAKHSYLQNGGKLHKARQVINAEKKNESKMNKSYFPLPYLRLFLFLYPLSLFTLLLEKVSHDTTLSHVRVLCRSSRK
jgi:hypothetical protein